MISKHAREIIKNVVKPMSDNGVIQVTDYKELLALMKSFDTKLEQQPKIEYISRKEAAALLKINVRTVDRLIYDDKLKAVNISKRTIRINKADIDNLLAGNN